MTIYLFTRQLWLMIDVSYFSWKIPVNIYFPVCWFSSTIVLLPVTNEDGLSESKGSPPWWKCACCHLVTQLLKGDVWFTGRCWDFHNRRRARIPSIAFSKLWLPLQLGISSDLSYFAITVITGMSNIFQFPLFRQGICLHNVWSSCRFFRR